LILGVVLVYAAWVKLRAPWPQFAVSINSYQVVPLSWLEPLARTLPWVELVLGLGVISGFLQRWFGLASSLLLGFFFSLMIRSYAIGLNIDCGCFGPGEALGPMTMLRDGTLVALALVVTVTGFRQNQPNASAAPAAQPHLAVEG
jgi:uncharacterized membrane protein YphA (DoxX/SURF4 family)